MAGWDDDWIVVAMVAGLLAAAAGAGILLLHRVRRRRALAWARWRRDHARRLPWELFRRRGTLLRLTDARTRGRQP